MSTGKHSHESYTAVHGEVVDQRLLEQLREDDGYAFEQLYDRYWANLFEYAYNRLRDRAISQDVVQDVFLDIWRRRHTLEVSNMEAYLRSSVRFKTYRLLTKMSLDAPYFEGFEEVLVSAVLADDQIQERELRDLLDLWIKALPAKRRTIFMMHFTDGLSTAEIANRLGVSRKTIQNQLNTAYSEIQKRYEHLLSVVALLFFWD